MRLKGLFIFGLGVTIGSAITYKVVSDKYESLIDDEIESVKESLGFYNKVETEVESEDEEPKADQEKYDPLKMDKKNYENMIAYHKYCQTSDEELAEREHPEDDEPEHPGIEYERITRDEPESGSFRDNIYFIPPEEYAAINDYEVIDLTLYNDGVLCDDMDEIVEDWDQKVGNDYKNYFGKNLEDPDVIHIRNDIFKCDYEITRDLRDYASVVWGRPPHFID